MHFPMQNLTLPCSQCTPLPKAQNYETKQSEINVFDNGRPVAPEFLPKLLHAVLPCSKRAHLMPKCADVITNGISLMQVFPPPRSKCTLPVQEIRPSHANMCPFICYTKPFAMAFCAPWSCSLCPLPRALCRGSKPKFCFIVPGT